MTQVRFVQLDRQEKALHLCRLAEEHFLNGSRVLVVVDDENRAVTLDRFMWGWDRGSFLPHSLANGSVDCLEEPVVVTTIEQNPNQSTVLIMGTPCSLEFMSRFECVYDFAETYDDQLAELARNRFRSYRAKGYHPVMHADPEAQA